MCLQFVKDRLTNMKSIQKVFVKIAGDDEEAISGEYITLVKNQPYNYEKKVSIPSDYAGKLDLKFGFGRSDGDPMVQNGSFSAKITNLSFSTTAVIPDPSYAEMTTNNGNSGNNSTTNNGNAGNNETNNSNINNTDITNNVSDVNNIDNISIQQIQNSKTKIISAKSKKKRSVKIIIKKHKKQNNKKIC